MFLDEHAQSPNERFHRQLLFKVEISYAENGKVSVIIDSFFSKASNLWLGVIKLMPRDSQMKRHAKISFIFIII